MQRVGRRSVVILAVALLYSTTPGAERWLFGAVPESATVQTQVVNISAPLGGKVLYPDGKTPAANVSVRVLSVPDNKEVFKTRTDANGFYKLQKFPPGRYAIIYDNRVQVNMLVVSGTEPALKFLNVIIPRVVVGFPLLASVVVAVAGGAIAVGVIALAGGPPPPPPPPPVVSP